MIQISSFASTIGNPIVTYLDESRGFKENSALKRVWFLAGNPALYGHPQMKIGEKAYEAVKDSIMAVDNHGYVSSTGDEKAKAAIIKHFGGGKKLRPEDVCIVSGVNNALYEIFNALCKEGDNILVPELGYPFYQEVGRAAGVEVREYRLLKERDFEVDLEHLAALIDGRTRFVYVVNPSNPMGTVFSREHMRALLRVAEERRVPLLADEVYYNQTFEEGAFCSFGHLAEGAPVIVASGMEKTFCVPGWCTSWYIIFDEQDRLRKLRPSLLTAASILLHTNSFVMHALPAILDGLDGPAFARSFAPVLQKNHDYLLERLQALPALRPYAAKATIYLAVELLLGQLQGLASDTDFTRALLEEENVNVLPLSTMGGKYQGFRLLTCATKELYDELLHRLARFLARHANK